jgi:hypothetical protein
MQIIETPEFTKRITSLLPDDDYNKLQQYLIGRPDAGALIIGGAGLRKIRWNVSGRGKSGGIRTIYYWNHEEDIYMLLCYQKNEQENLTSKQLLALRNYLKRRLK